MATRGKPVPGSIEFDPGWNSSVMEISLVPFPHRSAILRDEDGKRGKLSDLRRRLGLMEA